MTFIMREILESAASIAMAKELLNNAKRIYEYFYILADGKTKESFSAFATSDKVSFISPGETYKFSAYIKDEIKIENPFFEIANEKILVDQVIKLELF